ncbi:G-type lectin S-receptor-like serine/threonine-protein kinase At1g11330 [Gossypium hirsutum]|uniref:G-type lectin S-receptor-like serine/threonine-protein kinase At1g11330 n=1 Tax=Gossypium hirsutum TaxID=3635 RepID=A0ABM2ZM97_GOSHI|nr:G-type lectin S-receptor-like serine/threonine-protein kinase At1g11330 [Gossypium hirsutum]
MRNTISCSVLLALISCFYLLFATASHTITASKSIKDPDVIISQNGVFRLGFFSLANSSNRYVGILYHQIPLQTVVWVANRNRPPKDFSGILTISDDGNLVVSNGKAEILWSTNVTNLVPNATTAQLLDSGNLVLNNGENGGSSILWESFQHPSNVFLQTMKISTDVKTGRKTRSWKSPDDPSDGNFFQGIEPFSIPEDDVEKTYYETYEYSTDSRLIYFELESEGRFVERIWDAGKGDWINGYSSYLTDCDVYGKCGAFGICDSTKRPICSCLKGFKPRNIEEWNRGNWSSGCFRTTCLHCQRDNNNGCEAGQGDDGFLKLKKMKVPAFPDQSSITNGECKDQCMKNCSCVAYAYDAGIGCMLWSGDLIDVQKFSNRGVDLYIRLTSSELDKWNCEIIVVTTVISGMVVIIIISALFLLRRMGQQRGESSKVVFVITTVTVGNYAAFNSLLL